MKTPVNPLNLERQIESIAATSPKKMGDSLPPRKTPYSTSDSPTGNKAFPWPEELLFQRNAKEFSYGSFPGVNMNELGHTKMT
jgi:hypothetical protein